MTKYAHFSLPLRNLIVSEVSIGLGKRQCFLNIIKAHPVMKTLHTVLINRYSVFVSVAVEL